jgi:molecular chaperone DnaK (HSP70)
VRLGIDFGTTKTVVAVCDRGNYPVLRFDGPDGTSLDGVPTLVAARGSELRFGLDALAVANERGFTLLRSFKRLLAGATLDHEIAIGESRHPASTILEGFLAHLRRAIRESSNLPRHLRKKASAASAPRTVVAVPAHAHGVQRFLTLEAFRRAGFDVIAILAEPSAAGFEFTHAHRTTLSGKRTHVVVYDLGGGTFDASLVRVSDLRHDAVVTAGDARLGGDDFDEILVSMVAREAGLDLERLSAGARTRLAEACREGKERLHANSRRVIVELEGVDDTIEGRAVALSTAEYFAACTPLVERTIEVMMPVVLRAGLDSSAPDEKTAFEDVAGIYVVGGASALPIVGRHLRERFGRRVHRSAYPTAATAVGLAIAADDEAGFEIGDRFSRTFGVFREAHAGRDVAFDVIFDRDTPLPNATERPLRVERRYRVAHDLGHYRYVECTATDRAGAPTGDLSLFAEVRFPFVAELQRGDDLARAGVRRLPELGPSVREVYELDAHGLVRLSIEDESTGHRRTFELRGGAAKS